MLWRDRCFGNNVCDRLRLWLVESVSLPDPLADRIATRRGSGGEEHKSYGLFPDIKFLHVCSWWLWIGDHTSKDRDIFNFSPGYKQNSEKHTLKLFSQARWPNFTTGIPSSRNVEKRCKVICTAIGDAWSLCWTSRCRNTADRWKY